MLNLLSPALFTNHRGQSKADAPSPAIWSRIKGEAVSPDGTEAMVGVISNLQGGGGSVVGDTTGSLGGSGLQGVGSAANHSAVSLADGSGVRLRANGNGSGNVAIVSGGDVGGIGQLSLSKVTAFEAHLKFTESASNAILAAVGVCEPAIADTAKLTDTHGSPDSDFVGFVVEENSTIEFVYQTQNGNKTTVSGVSQAITNGTGYKVGFIIDPNSAEERLRVYVDGVLKASKSKADLDADANWPDDINFCASAGVRGNATGNQDCAVKFMHCIQVG